MKKGVIILGSSNSKGDTFTVCNYLTTKTNFPILDLLELNIGYFDYQFRNKEDDFIPIIKEIVHSYELLVFATPVYWYTMSGTMKVFYDRLSDCLKTEKELGRKLRGKDIAVISCGYDQELKKGFHMPFVETAKYLGMNYIGDVHTWIHGSLSHEVMCILDDFIEKVLQEREA